MIHIYSKNICAECINFIGNNNYNNIILTR